jgi:flagellin-like protein
MSSHRVFSSLIRDRGISTVIAAILMIVLVVALAAVVLSIFMGVAILPVRTEVSWATAGIRGTEWRLVIMRSVPVQAGIAACCV